MCKRNAKSSAIQPLLIFKVVFWVKRLLSRAQMTRATVYGVATVSLRFLTVPISAILIMARFSPELQGYYYTFASVLALQIFVELGLSNIITYFAGHEWARLSLDPLGRIIGEATALSRLISLGRAAIRWYLIGGTIVAVGLGMAGYIFFSRSPVAGIGWVAPWFVLCFLSGINLVLMPIWSLLQGCGQVSQVYSFRMVGTILSALATFGAIYFGAKLWVASISTMILLVWSAIYLVWRYRGFFRSFLSRPTGPRISWWGEIWQVQWRTALSYLSGYFISQVFTPILFYFHGPTVAGQFGMTWSLAMGVVSVAAMWSTPRGPEFAVMIARKEYKAINQLLERIIKAALGVLLLGGLGVWLLVYGLNMLNPLFAKRLLPLLPTALLLLGNAVANSWHPTTVYLRAHKREPYVAISIVSGIMIGLSSFVLGMKFAADGVAIAFLAANLILLPWGLRIFFRRRHEWHGEIS
jgi:O-antigen/teichoic acid export membrane protein